MGVPTQKLLDVSRGIERTGAHINVDHPLPEVIGHYALLVQVMTNLVGEALKFVRAGEKPSVRIDCIHLDGVVRLETQDQGIGIDPRYHQRIFNVVERLHGQETYRGTGIGLAIVKRSVERMGGRCGVDSPGREGKADARESIFASTFWIELSQAQVQHQGDGQRRVLQTT
jgi:light-regulated signal transduction histidine kinase (bacteriophytochrome)